MNSKLQEQMVAAQASLVDAQQVLAGAKEKEASAKGALETAHQALADATRAFKADPSAKTATSKMVAEQLFANAKEELDTLTESIGFALQGERRAMARIQQLEAMKDGLTFDSDVELAITAIVESEATIRAAVTKLQDRIVRHRKTLDLLNGVPPEAVPVQLPPNMSVPMAQERVKERLRQKYGNTPIFTNQIQPMSGWIFLSSQ